MVDVPGDPTTNATINLGGTTDNAIEVVGDHDWYKITLTAGQKITIAVNIITLEDPYVYIRNSSGTVLGENDDGGGGRGSRLVFTAAASGTYYIDVAAWAPSEPVPNYTGTGAYRLSVNDYVAPSVGTLDDFANQMTHGFFDGASHHFDVTQGGTITIDLTAITANGRAVALRALEQWSDIIGVNFVEQSGGAQITFDDLEQGTGAFANAIHSNGIISSAIVNVSLQRLNLHTYMHEIGHALGIGHTSNSNAGTAAAIYPNDALWSNDAAAISIMSYFDNAENGYYANRGFSHVPIWTPQVADIIAMGNLYGLSTSTRVGDTTYGFNHTSGREAFDATLHPNISYTIFDSGGIDTLDYSGFVTNQLIDLNPEAFSNIGPSVGNVVIARGTVIENAISGNGADTIIGNSSNNVLTGGLGTDAITGGAGSDTFMGTASGLNGDTIMDFSIGDRIIVTNAAEGAFTFSLSGNTLNYTGGSLTLAGVSAGHIVASAAPVGGVQLMIAPYKASGDTNGDGRSDILWRNDSGLVMQWLGQANGSFAASAATYQAPTNWQVRAVGDLNGDSRADIVWRTDGGTVMQWLGQANGSFAASAATYQTRSDWDVAAVGDLNGDYRADIVWRTDGGTVMQWLGQANGSFAASAATYQAPTDWQIAAMGDLNGDSRADIVWRTDGGTVMQWLGQANGSFAASAATYQTPTDWHIEGSGDFNGDNLDDIVWRTDSGLIMQWLGRADGSLAASAATYQMPTDWHVASTGDFNGDHRDDVLWRHDSGTVMQWLGQANGSFAASAATYQMPNEWHIQPSDLF